MAKKPSKLRESITAAYFVAELRDWILEQKSRYTNLH